MKNSIVFKCFILTSLLFAVMLLIIGATQNYFFKNYYFNKKLDTLKNSVYEYTNIVANKGTETASKFIFDNSGVWIATLDEYGRIYGVNDYYIEVDLRDYSKRLQIPMYPFEAAFSSDVIFSLKPGDEVVIDAVNILDSIIPYQVQTDKFGLIDFNIANKLHGSNADDTYSHLETRLYYGTITKAVFPEKHENIPFPLGESLFLEQIKQFQSAILLNPSDMPTYVMEVDVTENFANYKIIVESLYENERIRYIFAMISMQPIDEAILVIQQFYPYFFGFSFLCVLLLAFVFSRWLAKPLKSINRITGQMANMNFAEQLPIRSDDEIGQLSQSINYMSTEIEKYINRLKDDLDKERKLENTRKEFIAGVSHELKTPLAVMKSCLSIIKDGIVTEKREHYIQAMENEIVQMDILIVNMLDLAKFKSGTYKPEMAPFEIDLLINEVCKTLSDHIHGKNISLVLNVYPQTVVGHKGLISRVLTNFLTNAIRHTESGKSITITIIPNNSEKIIEVSVVNEGDGILETDIKNIWTQFYRASERKSGTGLGLSISKEILELHKASYGVQNTENGVRFFFSLQMQ